MKKPTFTQKPMKNIKPVTSKDVPGTGAAKKAAKAMEARKRMLDRI